MATQGSTIFTVGTLLSRAQDQGVPVRVLVQGVWLEGTPVASDGHGVVLDNPVEGQYLVRTDAVTVVVYLREAEAGTAGPEQAAAPEAPGARTGYAARRRPAVEQGRASA